MIPVQKVLVRYTVTTGVLEYAVPFALYGTGDVNVSWAAAGDTETQTRLAPGSDYSVTVFRDMTGGKVTLADGKVPAGATLAIESAVPLTQELDLSNTATVDTEATEGQLDRMVQMIQQLDDGLSRAVKVNATDSGTPEELLGSLYRARDDAQDAATAATASEQAAEGSEQAAATSASQAAASEQAAAASAEGADQSRAEAAASAAAASQSATAARQSAEAAAGSENRAAESAASILELQVEVATLDPGLPASGDYDPETGILHLGIPKGDSGASAIATPTSLGSVMPQTGDEDGLSLEKDGKLRVREADATRRGSVLASVTAAANAVPQAGEDGTLDESWLQPVIQMIEDASPGIASKDALGLVKIGTGLAIRIDGTLDVVSNEKEVVFTTSNSAWKVPETAVYRVTCIGGGGTGGKGGTSNDESSAAGGGGGGASIIKTITVALEKGNTVAITVGGPGGTSSFGSYISSAAGATGGAANVNTPGTPGSNEATAGTSGNTGYFTGGTGGKGANGYGTDAVASNGSSGWGSGVGRPAGPGGAGGKGYGAGGGGGGGSAKAFNGESKTGGNGGKGSQGVVIINYTSMEESA